MSEFKPNHIRNIPRVQPRKNQGTGPGSTVSGTGLFNDLLSQKEIEKTTPSKTDTTESSLPEVRESFTAGKVKLKLEKHIFGQKLETAVYLLEKYAGQVAHPQGRLKQAWETLEQASEHLRALQDEFKNDGLEDHQLEKILKQMDATIQAEQIKFRRGDYT